MRCGDGSAGSENIIDEENALMRLNGIGLDFECIGSIFKLIRLLMNGTGKFAGLANQNGSATEGVGEGRAKDKAA